MFNYVFNLTSFYFYSQSHESYEKIENEASILKTNLSEKDSLIRDLQETVSELKEHIEMLSHKDNGTIIFLFVRQD